MTVANTPKELKKLRKQPAWLINGEFTRINQGSRALRIALGLGTGATKLETFVRVYALPRWAKLLGTIGVVSVFDYPYMIEGWR